MRVYWKDVNRGQNLVITELEGHEKIIGGFRETKSGIDAYAQTLRYDPDRSGKGFATIDMAKDFVESFKPWELSGLEGVTVEREPRTAEALDTVAAEATPSIQPTESEAQGHRVRWWEFWRSRS